MNIYIARQPIYNTEHQIYGYEFLYRDSDTNSFNPAIDGSTATRTLISNLINEFGVEAMTNGRYAFVNFTKELLMTNFPFLLDRDRFIIEILENVSLDDTMLKQLKKLKTGSYKIALDDYTGGAENEQFESIEILKVDFMATTPQERQDIALLHKGRRVLLAEKIETEAEYNSAVEMGYTLFQGYYFSRPVPFSKPVTQITSTTCNILWEEMQRPVPSFDKLADIISKDVDLMYKFLTKANTMAYYRGARVTDIRQAIMRMGLAEIRRWVIMILVNDIMGKGNADRTRTALTRGSFAEKLIEKTSHKNEKENAYLACMFSVIEADVQSNLLILLDKFGISCNVSNALLGTPGFLTDLLHFILAYEAGDWDHVSDFVKRNRLDEKWVVRQYMNAITYAEQTFPG